MKILSEFQGYNIIEGTCSTHYGVRHGVIGLDVDRADTDGYPYGICFRDKDINNLKNQIRAFVNNFSVPANLIDGLRGLKDIDSNVISTTPLTELGMPEIIEIDPASVCNLKCIMCPQSYDRDRILANKTIIDPRFIKNLTGVEGKWICMGAKNEPSTHPQFVDILNWLTDLGAKIDLTSNATLLTKTLTKKIADCNFTNVCFSFDGIKKQTYESIRKGSSYENTIENILYFKDAVKNQSPYFTIQTILMRRTVDELSDLLQFWEGHGFNHMGVINLILGNLKGELKKESLESVTDSVYKKFDEAARLVIEKNLRITLSSSFSHNAASKALYPANFIGNCVKSNHPEAEIPFNVRTFFQNGYFPGMHVGCRSPFKYVRILFNGDVTLCAQFVIGNIYEQNLVDIWYGQRAGRVRKMILKNAKICHECDYYRLCLQSGTHDLEKDKTSFLFAEAINKYHDPTLIKRFFRGYNIFA
jgi:radical SAM protein with 4Fe4S-binding SPASM domain